MHFPEVISWMIFGEAASPVRCSRGRRTAADAQTAYVRNFLTFLGITDVEFVYAEGLAIDAASNEKALSRASQEIERLNGPSYFFDQTGSAMAEAGG